MTQAEETALYEQGCAMRAESFAIKREAEKLPPSEAREMAILTAAETRTLLPIDLTLAQRHLEASRKHLAQAKA